MKSRAVRRPSVLPVLAVLVAGSLAACASSRDDEPKNAAAGAVTSEPFEARDGEESVIATLALPDLQAGLAKLVALELDVAGVNVDASEADVIVPERAIGALAAEGFVVVRSSPVDPRGLESEKSPYQSPEEVEAALRAYADKYPSLAEATAIGTSVEGRSIWALKIAKDVKRHAPEKPVILFNGMHHAREVMTPEVPLDTIETLLAGYGEDADVTRWVDANEIWVVPMLNVDGNHRVWNGNRMWRKNTSGCAAVEASGATCTSGTGVDINRNYPYQWGACQGSSSSPRSQTYRGPSPASEPETRAMTELVDRIRPVFDISYHSYSELVLYPFGCRNQHAPTRAVLETLGRQIASVLPKDDGPGTYKAGTPWEILYGVDGGDVDWMYDAFHVVPFVIELNSSRQGFHPRYELWRDPTVFKARAAWQLLLDRLEGTGVRGVARDASGAAIPDARVEVASLARPASAGVPASEERSVNPDGSFHVVLLPGRYRVTVSAKGHGTLVREVELGARRVDLQVVLD